MAPMIRAMDAQPVAQSCPFLGLPDDRATHFTYPHPGHRCLAKRRAAEIELDYQAGYCLADSYTTCARYEEGLRRGGAPIPVRAAATGLADAQPVRDPTVALAGRQIDADSDGGEAVKARFDARARLAVAGAIAVLVVLAIVILGQVALKRPASAGLVATPTLLAATAPAATPTPTPA